MSDQHIAVIGPWRRAGDLGPVTARRWLDAIDAYVAAHAHALSAGTLAKYVKGLRRLALFAKVSPWHMSAYTVTAWLESIESDTARSSLRMGARSFYRWAVAAGHMVDDPTAHLMYRAHKLGVPPAWEAELEAYRRYMWSQGMLPNTIHHWNEQLRTVSRMFPRTGPYEVTTDDLFEAMAGKPWARETRRGRKTLLRGFYRWARATGRTEVDPTENMPKIRASDPVARPATDAEYAAAVAAAKDERVRLAMRLAAELGLRREEVSRIHSADLTPAPDGTTWLTVHGKGNKVRRIPVPPGLAATLRALPLGYAFPGQIVDKQAHATTQGHLSPRYLGKQVADALPPGVTMHMLRHRFATRVYNVDRDVFTVQRLLGHASPATTQRYVQVADERMRALVETVSTDPWTR